MRPRAVAALVVIGVSLPVAAAAQSGFVQAGYAVDVKRFSREAESAVFDTTTRALAAGAAGFLTPRVSVGVELDFAGSATVSETVSVTIGGRPETIQTDYTSRRRTVSAMAGVHSAGDRPVRLSAYAGLAFTAFRREIASNAPPIVVQDPQAVSVLEERITGPIVGVDVAIRLGPRAAIVPGLRAQGLRLSGELGGFSIRPTISGRILF